MGIEPNWIIRHFSDGQRRCIQIHIGLIQPFKFPLFENIRMSIDVCLRQYLPRWIKKYSKERSTPILYATQICDGID